MKFRPFVLAALLSASTTAFTGCGSDGGATPESVVENYANIMFAKYSDALSGAEDLQIAIGDFLDDPSEGSLENARQAWIDARVPYQRTEFSRFFGSPIDGADADGSPENRINAWPLDEARIEYIIGDEDEGDIDVDLLIDLNMQPGEGGEPEKNVTAGYHAIEFLLWGADDLNGGFNNVPGDRPYTDYTTDEDADNRSDFLATAAQLLVDDLTSVVEGWDPDVAGNYREEFLAQDPLVSLGGILSGLATLTAFEMAGERIGAAVDTGDQEEEHSCFSDNTINDYRDVAVGIAEIYAGKYGSVSGPSLEELIAQASPDLADRIGSEIQDVIDAMDAIEGPFDQAILEGNPLGNAQVQDVRIAYETLGESWEDVAAALDVAVENGL